MVNIKRISFVNFVKNDLFSEGTRVKVLGSDKKNHKETIGCFGTIKNSGCSTLGVLIDEQYNQSSNKGLFWYDKWELEIIESEENNMAKLTGYKAVAVVKQGFGNYHFAIYEDGHEYKAGDKILVTGSNSGVLTIEEVISPEEALANYPKDITSEVITYVDKTAYEKRLESRKAADELKKKMDAEIKKMDETEKYAMYAIKNPELAKMLDEYKNLVGF